MLTICCEPLERVMRDNKNLPIGGEYVEGVSKSATQFSEIYLMRVHNVITCKISSHANVRKKEVWICHFDNYY